MHVSERKSSNPRDEGAPYGHRARDRAVQTELKKGRKEVVLEERKVGQQKPKIKTLFLSAMRNINSERLFI